MSYQAEVENRLRAIDWGAEQVFQHHGTLQGSVVVFWRALRRLQTGLSRERFLQEWRTAFPEDEMVALTNAVRRLKS